MPENVSPFTVHVECIEDAAVVVVTGEIDLDTGRLLLREAHSVLATPVRSLALDLGEATFIDSAGIAVLLNIHADAVAKSVPFALAAVSHSVRHIIHVTGLTETFGL